MYIKNKGTLLYVLILLALLSISGISNASGEIINCEGEGKEWFGNLPPQPLEINVYKGGSISMRISSFDTVPQFIPIRRNNLDTAIAIIEEYRFMKLELKAKDENIAIMANQIDTKNKQIAAFKKREKTFTNLIDAYKQDSALAASQINVYKGMTTSLKKDLKKQRTKTTLAIIGGIVMSGVTLYLTTR